jgi:hypothetical protein
MNAIAHIVMAVWIPTVLVLFALLPPRRAVIVSFFGAWMFLPMISYELPMLPNYTKMSATCAGVFIASLIFDVKRLLRFKPRWVDVPMAIFCACPFITSLLNGLGLWDGVSGVLSQVITWGLPYLIGRLYLNDLQSMRELAIAFLIGGLLYVPLCLFEVRMSPQLHNLVYGFFRRLVQIRFGGWRPAVFMDGGLQVGMWMTAASLMAIWLWKTEALKRMWGVSMPWLLVPLVVTTILCRASGALALLGLGLAVMWVSSATKSRLALACLLLIAPIYLCLRASGMWHGEPVISIARSIDKDRADSLKFRFDNEDILAAKALQRPWFGWGSWGRNRVHDQWGKDLSVTDGLWIIEFGQHGAIGLAACFAFLLLPLTLLTRRYSASRLTSVQMSSALPLAVLVTLYAVDCLPNAMINPIFTLVGGAVTSFALASQSMRHSALQDEPFRTRKDGLADAIPSRRPYPSYM